MPERVIKIYKQVGQTPLECINNLKKKNSGLEFLPMTYAGRLDPLAEGILLILVGDECLKKDEYLALPKEYEVEILLGFATDTYDIMGLIKKTKELVDVKPRVAREVISPPRNDKVYLNNSLIFSKILPQFIGRIRQSYPPYSSRTVNGKPLFAWAREGKLSEIEIPSHDVFVENIEIIKEDPITGSKLLKYIQEKISLVKGDFRQSEIISTWEDELNKKGKEVYPIVKLRISCGSGVYVRGLADEIGKRVGVPALALSIKRTKVGEYF